MTGAKSSKKPQLHVSMLNMLSKCGVQFQRRYGARFGVWHEEEIIPPSVALAIGISVHAGVAQDLKHKRDHQDLLPLDKVRDVVADEIKGIWDGGLLLTEEESGAIQNTQGSSVDQAVQLVTVHHQDLAPHIDPLGVEEPFVIALDGYPIDLSGTKDVRTVDAIRDTKTSKRSPAADAARSMQMGMYSLNELKERGALPKAVFLDYLVKLKTPKVVSVQATPDMSWIDPLLKRIERFVEIIEAVKTGHKAFTPANAEDWACSAKYCGYHQDCPYWSGK